MSRRSGRGRRILRWRGGHPVAHVVEAERGYPAMSFWRAVLCLVFPPLAVLDRGCGTVLIVAALSMVGWVPGVLAALYINIEYDRR